MFIKTLSKSITSVFELMFNQFGSYKRQSSFFSGAKSFWRIFNNQTVIVTIKNLNGRNKATSISCFDFSTLYTNISCGKLVRDLNEHIGFCFKGRSGQFIVVN